MNSTNYMAHVGATLIDRGFSILPIQPSTKKPGMYRRGTWHDYPQWSRHCQRDTTDHEIDLWANWPGAGVGVAAGRVIGIDIDVAFSAEIALRSVLAIASCPRTESNPCGRYFLAMTW